MKLDDLLAHICQSTAGASGAIATPPQPSPLVHPPLAITDESEDLAREIIILQASAAVGKSILSRYIAAKKQAAWLDLAAVKVATRSLEGLISSDLTPRNPLADFHAGKVPFVIDGLDEGPTRSPGFAEFLETTGQLLASNRDHAHVPKLIMLARIETAKRIEDWCDEHGLLRQTITIDFFDRDSAERVIYAYAGIREPRRPHREFVQTYFSAIEKALGIGTDRLFADLTGRRFAGYAPVLRALGRVVADESNIYAATQELMRGGGADAWSLLERVVKTLLARERDVLTNLLDPGLARSLPADAFAGNQQLTLLAAYVPAGAIDPPLPGGLTPKQAGAYHQAIRQRLPEHPFVEHCDGALCFSNEVFASLVLAEGITHATLTADHDRLLASASRQPFLWRAMKTRLGTAPEFDGRHVGYLLRSLWNDPLSVGEVTTMIDEDADGFARIRVAAGGGDEAVLTVLPPVELYGDVQGCVISDVALVLAADEGALLNISDSTVTASVATRGKVDAVNLMGGVELLSDSMEWATSDGKPVRVILGPQSTLILHGAFNTYPWNQVGRLAPSSQATAYDDLIAEWRSRFPSDSVAPLPPTLEGSHLPSTSESRLRWVLRNDRYRTLWPILIQELIDRGLTTRDEKETQTAVQHYILHFNVGWDDLIEGHEEVRARVNAAAEALGTSER